MRPSEDALVQEIYDTSCEIADLNKFITIINAKVSQFTQNPTYQSAEDMQRLETAITNRYDELQKNLSILLSNVNSTIQDFTRKNQDTEILIPRKEEVQSILTSFFKSKLKMKKQPIPNDCGAYAHTGKMPTVGEFVCGFHNNKPILMVVARAEGQTLSVFDPTEEDQFNVVKLDRPYWTQLPNCIPEKPSQLWEHQKGATVLSLWPQDDGEWTTMFYPAKVIDRPCDRYNKHPERRGYALEFEEGNIKIVPEKFVVNYPELWQQLSQLY